MTLRARRGQAAMEYLVTYGWGILAILVAIGALAYFGLLDIDRYVPDRCSFGAQLECTDYQVRGGNADVGGLVYLQVRNNMGERVSIVGAYYDETSLPLLDENCVNPGSVVIAAGNVSEAFCVALPTTASLLEDDRQAVRLTLEFQRTAPAGPLHNVSGEVFGTAFAPVDYSGPPIIVPPVS